ncbi:virulence-associated E family protein [Acetobacteraceae bacterium KSS8]|uniref:Virulence-associated E family protein n=1 Tax=Endosaccharibacter trunci TaxID=2812733 RepID=A0ABT1WAH5_9PROT|nr:virulence-associated E family protein [Acetobacteraceae bacterium KSS8]
MDNVHPLRPRGMAWLGELSRGEKGPHATVSNTLIVLGNDPELAGLLAYDEFAHSVIISRKPPIPFSGSITAPGPYPRPCNDSDITLIQGYIQRTYDMRISQPVAQQACATAAEMNRVHPVRQYLAGLKWDGLPRLDNWLSVAFGAPEDAYHETIGIKFLVAGIRRIRQPGCKFDHVLVLEGTQGRGKSRSAQALFSPLWFKDDLSHDLGDKDAQQGMAGRWGVELAELQVLVRSTSQAAKSFFSRQVDHFRPSYGRSFVERPRQCIFIGTTNETDYLSDSTGNRRYWPVRCSIADVEWIEQNRDQLWAEAAVREAQGVSLWLDDDAVRQTAETAQESRVAEDTWTQKVEKFLEGKTGVTTADILFTGVGLAVDKMTRASEMRVAAIAKTLGWHKHDYRGDDGKKTRGWFPPGAWLPKTTPPRQVPPLGRAE